MKIIETAWRNYAERIVPPHAGKVRRRETRRAFYAGARSLFSGIIAAIDPGEEATDNDLANLDSIQSELDEFKTDVAEGRA